MRKLLLLLAWGGSLAEMVKSRLATQTRRRLECVNDDSTTDSYGDTCSAWYDSNPGDCGSYDDEDFIAIERCCACGGGLGMHCQQVPGATAKYRCFDCADASAPASVGDGQCDAANNVSPCWDGGDCCETTCIDGDTHTCGSYDCKDPDAPPVPDPYYPDAAWC